MDIYNLPQEITIQGNTIRYYRQGAGQTILFVHGITTYSFIWQKIVPYFTSTHDVIVLDLLGCGDSDKPLYEDISLKCQAFMLHDFCFKLGITNMHLVCHDVGGGIGQIFAANFSSLLYSLTLINSVAYNFWPVQPIIAMRTPIIRQIALATLDLGMFEIIVKRGLFHKERCTKELMELFWKPMKTAIGRKAFLHFAKCLDNSNLTEIEREISQLSMPVLIIRGNADVYLASTISETLHNHIAHSEYKCISTAGHFIQEDEPELLATYLHQFIEA